MRSSIRQGLCRIRPHVRGGKPSGQWQLDVPASLSDDGKRQRLSFESKTAAKAEAERLYRERMLSGTFTGAFPKRKSGISFETLAAKWIVVAEDSVELGTIRASTLQKNLYHLKPALRFLSQIDISEVGEDKLRSYQLHRKREGRKPSTINSEVGTILVLLGWAKQRQWLSGVPTVRQLPVEHTKQALPTPSEVAEIVSLLPERLRALVLILASTGLRRGEVLSLPWHHVDLDRGTLRIAAHRDWKPKNSNSTREFRLHKQALAAIGALPRKGYYVFPGKKGDHPIDNFRKALARALQTFAKNGGRPLHITPKTFRKAFASWQALKGTPEVVTQDLLGHVRGSRITKEVYTHLPDDEYIKAHIEIPLREQQPNAPSTILATNGNRPRKRGKVGS